MSRAFGSRRPPLTCLVTDRQRYGLHDRAVAGQGPSGSRLASRLDGAISSRVAAAARAGVDLVHLRERDLGGRDLLALTVACVEICRGTDTLVVVNERVDVALSAGADGVHLRSGSLPAAALRPLVPSGFLIGRSVHGLEDLVAGAGEGVDYLVAGTVFPSRSKGDGHRTLGPDGLAAVVRAARVPVLAIGGVCPDNAASVAAAGAAGIAAIGFFVEAATSGAGFDARLHRLKASFAMGMTQVDR